MANLIKDVRVATVRVPLKHPIVLGDYVLRDRTYVLVGIRSESGVLGVGYSLTRDAPVAEIVEQMIAPCYVHQPAGEPATRYAETLRRHPTSLASGIGLRALSVADIAAWDLAAKLAGQSIVSYLGGHPSPLQAIAVVGFPPNLTGKAIETEVASLYRAGWRWFKLPVGSHVSATRERIVGAGRVADDIEVVLDAVWTWNDAEEGARYIEAVNHDRLNWIEDPFPPGDAWKVADLRRRADVRVATGDEQGGPYFPEALYQADALDVLRLDITCVGGVTRFRELAVAAIARGLEVSSHVYGHLHEQVLSGLGLHDALVEFGAPGNGVDPFGDVLRAPVMKCGRTTPSTHGSGFGIEFDVDWLAHQEGLDPDGLLADLATAYVST